MEDYYGENLENHVLTLLFMVIFLKFISFNYHLFINLARNLGCPNVSTPFFDKPSESIHIRYYLFKQIRNQSIF